MNLSGLKPGDEVAVRNGKWHDSPRYELATVARVTKNSVVISDGRHFGMKTGDIIRDKDQLSADVVELTDDIRAKIGATT